MFFFKRKRKSLQSFDLSKDQDQVISKEILAESLFSGPEKYNCAQAILITFKSRFSITDAEIVSARSNGYGKVQGGLCGALYAGKYLLDDRIKSDNLTREFESKAGSSKCKKILKLKLLTCKECVALTARLVDEYSS